MQYIISVMTAICMYHLMMISINLSETAHFGHWKSGMSETNFFPTKNIFLRLDFVSDYIPQLHFICNDLIT